MRLCPPPLLVAALAAAAAAPALGAVGSFRVVATTGDGVGGAGVLESFAAPVVAGGGVAFQARLHGVHGAASAGVFREDGVGGGGVRAVALAGEVAFGGVGRFAAFNSVGADALGGTTFRAHLDGDGLPEFANGLYQVPGEPGATPRAWGVSTTDAPGGGVFDGVVGYGLSPDGSVGWTSTLGGTFGNGLNFANFTHAGGVTRAVARRGTPTPGGRTIGLLGGTATPPDAAGAIVFAARLDVIDHSADVGLFRGGGGGLTELAVEGGPAPGGGVYHNLHHVTPSGDGSYALTAELVGGGETLFASRGQGHTPVLASGDKIGGRTIGGFGLTWAADGGVVAAQIEFGGRDTGETGLVVIRDGGSTAVAFAGVRTPGPFDVFGSFPDVALNAAGQVAFVSNFEGSGEGLFLFDPRLGLLEVDRSARVFAPGRDLTDLELADRPGGSMDGLGDAGNIAYRRRYSDGHEEVVLWTPPEIDTLLPGDANLDGAVTIADFAVLRANFGSDAAYFTTGDLDGDGVVSIADFALLRANFGGTSAQAAELDAWAAAVPEPAGLAGLIAGGIGLTRRRRAAVRGEPVS